MTEGTLAEYEQLKALACSRFAEIEQEIANLRPLWRALKQAELARRKELMFGPDIRIAKETRPLPEWRVMAAEYRRAFRDAVAVGDYRGALFREGWARYAEYQAGLLQVAAPREADASNDSNLLVPRLGADQATADANRQVRSDQRIVMGQERFTVSRT
jgi:hypothetical protein